MLIIFNIFKFRNQNSISCLCLLFIFFFQQWLIYLKIVFFLFKKLYFNFFFNIYDFYVLKSFFLKIIFNKKCCYSNNKFLFINKKKKFYDLWAYFYHRRIFKRKNFFLYFLLKLFFFYFFQQLIFFYLFKNIIINFTIFDLCDILFTFYRFFV